MPDLITMRAPAKINLSLDVLGRRPDGYHELASVMQCLDLHDTLTFTSAPTLSLHCTESTLNNNDNLVLRAARLLRQRYHIRAGATIALAKRIPVEAGLAGGSSDCAAALTGLNALWALGLSNEELANLSAELGSDVPYFFYGPTALLTGRGETIQPLSPAPAASVVLVKPAFGISTAAVFAAFDATRYRSDDATQQLLRVMPTTSPWSWPLSNGLQETVMRLYPELAEIIEAFAAAGADHPIMTGSGSTLYAVMESDAQAERIANIMREHGHTAIVTRFADTHVLATGNK